MKDWRIAPVFVVSDIEASIRYYRDCLAFQVVEVVDPDGYVLCFSQGPTRP